MNYTATTLTKKEVEYSGKIDLDVMKDITRCEVLKRDYLDIGAEEPLMAVMFSLTHKDGTTSTSFIADINELAIIQFALEKAGIETIEIVNEQNEQSIDNDNIQAISFK